MSECKKCGCQGHGRTQVLTCVKCEQVKYPVLIKKPDTYTCELCRTGAGSLRKAAGRLGAEKKAARRKLQEATDRP